MGWHEHAVVASLAMLLACGASTKDAGADPVAELDAKIAERMTKLRECECARDGRRYRAFSTSDPRPFGPPRSEAGLRIDAARAEECLALFDAGIAICSNPLTDPKTAARANIVCGAAFAGTKKPGEACEAAWECEAPKDGFRDCTRQEGVVACRWLTPSAPAGAPCSTPGFVKTVCASDLVCDPGTNTCAALGDAGAKCSASVGCREGLFCDPSSTCVGPTAPIGAECTSSHACVREAYCGPAPPPQVGRCEARGEAGATCTSDPYFASGSCAIGLVCAPESATCVAPLGVGDVCEHRDGLDGCGGDLHCEPETSLGDDAWRGVCAAPNPDGAPCISNTDCASKQCGASPGCRDVCDLVCLAGVSALPYCF
jgi:hypothetical protein